MFQSSNPTVQMLLVDNASIFKSNMLHTRASAGFFYGLRTGAAEEMRTEESEIALDDAKL